MLITLKLLKKDSQMIIGGTHEYEDCAVRLDYLVSMGRHQENDDYCEVLFKGFGVPLVLAEPYEAFLERATNLALKWGLGRGFVQDDN